ncbi:MAG TPA: hypothetical protein VJN29_17545 [Intrasporangium sp.]|uniref:hypothetical protein n=1 Tax=Intrasporangium sp. TaxID=1925024 RepID=UPI002B469330|nr:hypothetical protein [Intrasporangium sp.]HKX69023.1 hypothetical protein [Intrasporangium sp.]
MPTPSRHLVTVMGGLVAAAVLAACANPAATGPGGTIRQTVGPMRTVTAQPVAADGALECPATISDHQGMTVPEPPQGVDGNARLLPDRQPESLVVCSYPVLDLEHGSLSSPFRLETRTVLSPGERSEMVELLTWAPLDNLRSKACTAMGGDETVHLIGSRSPDAIVWVAAKADPNGCSNSTNGDFVSSAALGSRLGAVFGDQNGRDPALTGACAGWGFGRLGDHLSIAPEGDPRVTVCRNRADGTQQALQLSAERSREVVAALRSLTARVSDSGCSSTGDDYSQQFRLVLDYAEGPAVWVNVSPACTPQAYSSGLAAEDAGSVIDLVEQWSPPIPGPDPDQPVSSDGSIGSGGSPGSGGSDQPGDPGTPVPPVAPRDQNPYPPDVTVTTVP